MNEKFLQLKLWSWRLKHAHKLIVPNSHLFYGESDVLSVSKKDFSYTHEIKVSKADFKAEFNKNIRSKWLWHDTLKNVFHGKANYAASAIQVPNYYMFVCPAGLIAFEEVPEYAGLIYWKEVAELFEVIKKPPRIHKIALNQTQKEKLAISLMWRCWNGRKTQQEIAL